MPRLTTKHLRGQVIKARSGFFDVQTSEGVIQCRMRGRLKKVRQSADIAVVGDWVNISISPDGGASLESVEARRTLFSRRQPGPRGKWKEDVIVANLDTLLIVFACKSPAFNPRMLDRFLVIAEHQQIEPIIIGNKIDLDEDGEVQRQFEAYASIGYAVHYTSVPAGIGIDSLKLRLADKTSAFAGASGVGKSSLMMAIEPSLELRVAEVSSSHSKGRHTTRAAELHPLAIGGYLVDTPGIREIGTWALPETELAFCFPEMRPHVGTCRFGDCSHLREPDCAIQSAVANGEITAERYESYARLFAGDDED